MPNITQKQIADNYLAYLQGQNSNINASAPFSYWSIIAGAEGSVFLDLYANLDIVSKAIYIQNLQGSQIDNKLYESGLSPRGALTVSVIGVTFPTPVSIPANTQFQTTNGIIYTLYQGVDYAPPIPVSFTTSATSGIVPFPVTFTNTTIGIPNAGFTWAWSVTGGTQGVDWNFINDSAGNPTSATTQNAVIQFLTSTITGTSYNVTLNASLNGVTYTPENVIITASPTGTVAANFIPSATSGTVPFPVTFNNTTYSGTPPAGITWSWTVDRGTVNVDYIFTNGTTANSISPQITFNIATTQIQYNVTLTPTLTGTRFIPKIVGITANPAGAVQADFSFSPLLPTTANTVVFTDTTPTPQPTGYAWSILPATGWYYTGGTSATSRNPSIQFTTAATYQVTNAPTGTVSYMTKTNPVPVTSGGSNPTVSLTQPNPTTNVPITPTVTLTFSEAVMGVTPTPGTSGNNGTIQFQSQGGLPQTIRMTTNLNSYTIQVGTLTYGTTYLVIINAGITSVATGLAIVATQFSFTTRTSATGNPNAIQSTPVTLYAIVGGNTTFIGNTTPLTTTIPIIGVPTTVTATVVQSTAGQQQESDQSCINRLLLQKRSPTSGCRTQDYYTFAKEASSVITDAITVFPYTTIDGVNSLGIFPLIGSFITENQLNAGLGSIVYPPPPPPPPTPVPPPPTFTQYTRQITDNTLLDTVRTYILSEQLLGLGVTVNSCVTYPLIASIPVTVSLPPIYLLSTVLQIPSLDVSNNVITISITISDLIKREVRRVICNQPYGATDLKDAINNFITLNDIIDGLNYQLSYNNGQIAKLLLDVKIGGGNIPVPKPQKNSAGNTTGQYAGIYDITTYDTISVVGT